MASFPGFPDYQPGDSDGIYKSQNPVDVAKIIFSLIICVLGLVGNLFAIFAILVLKEYKKSVTHWYVLQLAIADSLFLLTLPFKVNEDFNHGWIYPEWMCKAKETVLFLNYYASILFLVIMSIDRYVAVCHPFSFAVQKLRNRTSAIVITVAVWSVSLLLCIPVMLYSAKIGNYPHCPCSYVFPNPRNLTQECVGEGFNDKLSIERCVNISRNREVNNGEEHCTITSRLTIEQILGMGFGNINPGPQDGTGSEPDISHILEALKNSNFPFNPINNLQKNSTSDFNSPPIEFPPSFPTFPTFQSGNLGASVPPSSIIPQTNSMESMEMESSGYDPSTKPFKYHSTCHYWKHSSGWLGFIFFNFIVMFVIPFVIMVVCYGLIIHRLLTTKVRSTSTASANKSVRDCTSQKKSVKGGTSRSDRERKRVTVMCAVLVSCFLVCWLPFHAFHLAKVVGIRSEDGAVCVLVTKIGALLAYLNSTLNPYLYSFLGTNFCRRWKRLKDASGLQLVTFQARKATDTQGNSKSKHGDKNDQSRQRRNQQRNNISTQRPATLVTRIPKDNESSQALPSQTGGMSYDRQQTLNVTLDSSKFSHSNDSSDVLNKE